MKDSNWSNIIAKGLLKAFFTVVLLALILWFLYKISAVIAYLVISFIVVILGEPVKDFLMRRLKFSNLLATITVILFFLLILTGIFTLFIPLLVQQGKNLSVLNSEDFRQRLNEALVTLNEYLKSHGINLMEDFSLMQIFEAINFSVITGFFEGLFGMLGNFFVGLFSVIFISFFLLKDRNLTTRLVLKFIPRDERDRYLRIMSKIKYLLANYLGGLVLQITILFVIYVISLHLIGVPNATIIAFLSALLNLIPYVGPLISLILMITLSITSQLDTMDPALMFGKVKYILLMYTVAQLIDNFWTQPFIYSRSVRSHPLEIFLVILIAANLFGILGMIIAVPTYTVLKILVKEFYNEYKDLFVRWE
ncbi:MAG: AI-2E family transporter [Chlorobi bacterium]|nr:AI-2E family transporter [Chlorobiota bacterium]